MAVKENMLFLCGLLLIGAATSNPFNNVIEANKMESETPKTFLYFAYGSNMLAKRIHVNNPTAVQKYIGKLEDHRFDFNRYSKYWKGAASTIFPMKGSEVWGVVWEIGMENLENLDGQEGVHVNMYFAKDVIVHTPEGEELHCRVYQQTTTPDYVAPELLPSDRQPSYSYLSTVINGAKAHHIPEHYIKFLQSFPHNGNGGENQIPTFGKATL